MYLWDVETFYLVYMVYDEEIAMVATEVGQKLETLISPSSANSD